MAQTGPQEASRGPPELPKGPQDGPKRRQRGPRTMPRGAKTTSRGPKRRQDEPKMAPRRPQDGPKSLPRRIQDEAESCLIRAMLPRRSRREPKRPQVAPKRLQRAFKRSPRVPKVPIERPRSPQEPPKRPPRGLQDPTFSFRMAISCERGRTFNASPLACNMSPLGRRRGPALRAESGGRPEGRRLARSVGSRRTYSSDLASYGVSGPSRIPPGICDAALFGPKFGPSSAKLLPRRLQDGS